MSQLKNRIYIVISALLVLVVVTIAAYSNEARKEIYFLCGNFSNGVSEASVLKQLNTVSLSQFKVVETTSGKRIELESAINFGLYQCIIELDSDGNVTRADIE